MGVAPTWPNAQHLGNAPRKFNAMRSACGAQHHALRSNSGSLAIFSAMRRASSRVS